MEREMTNSTLLSPALIAAAMLATPATARTSHSHVTSRHLAVDAKASVSPTAHYFSGPVGIRAPRVPSDVGTCDVGDNPHIC